MKRAASNLSGRHVSGRCLCGAVELEIDFPAFWAWHDPLRGEPSRARRCVCDLYRLLAEARRVVKGQRSIARFDDAKTDSTRSFCSRCGTPLLYERKRSPHMVNIPRGALHRPYRPRAPLPCRHRGASGLGLQPANGLSPSRAILISSGNARNRASARVRSIILSSSIDAFGPHVLKSFSEGKTSAGQCLGEKRQALVHPVIDAGVVVGELLIAMAQCQARSAAAQTYGRHRAD